MNLAPTSPVATLDVAWTGPYGWPGYSPELPRLPDHPGVYLLTVNYRSGFLIYAAGLTRRPFTKRFIEHTRTYFAGHYNVLDIAAMRRGIRKRIFHGWDRSRRNRVLFTKRKNEIIRAVERQLAGYRIFVADLEVSGRILERVEAAVMNLLYSCPSPFCDIPDKGMLLMPRWQSESPICAINHCSANLYCLPREFDI